MIKQGTELDKAKYFLTEVKHLSDSDFMDSGVIDEIAELIVAYNEFNKTPFSPERSPKEEAEKMRDIYGYAISGHILNYTIPSLKAANVSTEWHEQVLNELRGM